MGDSRIAVLRGPDIARSQAAAIRTDKSASVRELTGQPVTQEKIRDETARDQARTAASRNWWPAN